MAQGLSELELELQNGSPCTIAVSGNSKVRLRDSSPKHQLLLRQGETRFQQGFHTFNKDFTLSTRRNKVYEEENRILHNKKIPHQLK